MDTFSLQSGVLNIVQIPWFLVCVCVCVCVYSVIVY